MQQPTGAKPRGPSFQIPQVTGESDVQSAKSFGLGCFSLAILGLTFLGFLKTCSGKAIVRVVERQYHKSKLQESDNLLASAMRSWRSK